jgi:uncharacterized protein (DUF2062 family)
MLKYWLKKRLPSSESVRGQRSLRWLGTRLTEPDLWYFNRRSVSGGAAVGLFLAFVPMPLQMVPAAIVALVLRVNLPTAILGVWITNPLTVAPIYYACYLLGSWLLGTPATAEFDPSWEWLGNELGRVGWPLLVGCLTVSSIGAVLGYLGTRWLWRWQVGRAWRARARRPATPG